MSNAERLFAAIDSYKDQMIEAQRTLVATPALGRRTAARARRPRPGW